MTQQTQDVLALRGQDLMRQDGDKLGTIEEIYLDTDTNQPEWALIATGLFDTKQSFVPISSAGREDDAVTVPFGKDAPKIDPDGRLSESEEQELHRHYRMDTAAPAQARARARRPIATTPSAATRAARPPTTP